MPVVQRTSYMPDADAQMMRGKYKLKEKFQTNLLETMTSDFELSYIHRDHKKVSK